MLHEPTERRAGLSPAPQDEVDAWFASRRVFFLVGLGRSGTKLLAEVLGRVPGCAVFHEPFPDDREALVAARHSDAAADEWIAQRKPLMREIAADRAVVAYGEANSMLRFHHRALRRHFPGAKILHLVRDGRDVVRSIWERRHYRPEAREDHLLLAPLPGEPLHREWASLERFEKICWLWADASRRLRTGVDGVVRFEDVIGSYEGFREAIETPLGIDVGRDAWERGVAVRVNGSESFSLPPWRRWERWRRDAFDRICGEEMRRHGYPTCAEERPPRREDDLEDRIELLETESEALAKELVRLSEDLTKRDLELATRLAREQGFDQQIAEVRATAESLAARLESAESRAAAAEHERAALTAALSLRDSRVAELERDVEAREAGRRDDQLRLARAQEDRRRLESALSRARAEIAGLREEAARAAVEAARGADEVSRLHGEIQRREDLLQQVLRSPAWRTRDRLVRWLRRS